MCILFWTTDNHPKYKFIFAGNRDEFFARPAARAQFWKSNQDVLSGIDLGLQSLEVQNGTWLGVTRKGRFAALTNFREVHKQNYLSRGSLPKNFLLDTLNTEKENLKNYAGFNLVCFDFGKKSPDMFYLTNRGEKSLTPLKEKELYGLSNSLLEEPWEKVTQGKELFRATIKTEEEGQIISGLFDMLRVGEPMPKVKDFNNITKHIQQRIFVDDFCNEYLENHQKLNYGTRTSTIVLIDYDDNVIFVERDWVNTQSFKLLEPSEYEDRLFRFKLEK